MKFISFIASTMLIVLISQHSMGLPFTSTIAGEPCSEGFEIFNGKCEPIQSSTIGITTETVTNLPEIITSTLPEEYSTTEVNSPKKIKRCPTGSKMLEDGQCGPVEPLVIKQLIDESTTSSILPATATVELEPTTLPEEDPATEASSSKISKRCPPGSRYLKSGKCGPIGPLVMKKLIDESTTSSILPATVTIELEPTVVSETTEMIPELTTGLNDDERTGGVDNPQGCPKGTEADEQGACQEMQGASTETVITEPNFPVNQTCPGGYEKFNGGCVYTETKTTADNLKPKTGDVETLSDEVVPISEDGTCPDETAYISAGFCKKMNRPTPANVPVNSDGRCRANYELVDEICVYKGNKILSELGVLASTIRMPLHATVDEGLIEVNTDNLFHSTATVTE